MTLLPDSKIEALNVMWSGDGTTGIGGVAEKTTLSLRYKTNINIKFLPDTDIWAQDYCRKMHLGSAMSRLMSQSAFSPLNAPGFHIRAYNDKNYPWNSYNPIFISTYIEFIDLPSRYVNDINQYAGVVAPSFFVKNSLKSSGVSIPIEVVSDGYDPLVFKYVDRPEREEFIFLCVSTSHKRKNLDIVMEVFKSLFDNTKNVYLVIRNPDEGVRIDGNIFINPYGHADCIFKYYQMADCFLALGSEGFGVPLIEALGTGLPAIALDAAGQSDVIRECEYITPVKDAGTRFYADEIDNNFGDVYIPDSDQLYIAMKSAYEHNNRDDSWYRHQWVLENRNIWDKGPKVIKALEKMI